MALESITLWIPRPGTGVALPLRVFMALESITLWILRPVTGAALPFTRLWPWDADLAAMLRRLLAPGISSLQYPIQKRSSGQCVPWVRMLIPQRLFSLGATAPSAAGSMLLLAAVAFLVAGFFVPSGYSVPSHSRRTRYILAVV
jgi:hypothetical protein